jgi:PPK2 family polyphosphate:nucleotide phosphotransferase
MKSGKLRKIVKRCRIGKPDRFRLADHDPAARFGLSTDAEEVSRMLADGVARLTELQQRLYASDRWAVLLILQGMDAAGKDSVIKHVMSGVNPQGCAVHSFKAPNTEELEHDYLWRASTHLPGRGRIGIFNRSYYEEVLVTRVHPELLEREKLPSGVIDKNIWKHRFKAIRGFERHLIRNGTLIIKFHLRISKEEQRKRFLARLEEPAKRWKFAMDDIAERRYWDAYMDCYQDMIRATATDQAPWYVVPADHKHVAWMVVAETIIAELDRLDLKYPKIAGAALKELKACERVLNAEPPPRAGKRG